MRKITSRGKSEILRQFSIGAASSASVLIYLSRKGSSVWPLESGDAMVKAESWSRSRCRLQSRSEPGRMFVPVDMHGGRSQFQVSAHVHFYLVPTPHSARIALQHEDDASRMHTKATAPTAPLIVGESCIFKGSMAAFISSAF